ncbi:putative quinol monooxygenase [Actinomadura rupiterrae]|uniref:putative quinol monooxygenase n=1 Tax=Actinomadura rupiterrae TaxID=559627 RepID=UPI0020A2A99F|nr:antibiotic biosynthesis monooxygenase family protein [Actinomadura rupiterrae]MCP2343487.1 quinol monooxygenase YgiN [Actinomadura rupiterrae]
MVNALLALLATLGALIATGLLVKRAYTDRMLYLIAWSVTSVGLSLALLAMTAGFLMKFNGPVFRVEELGAALLAPVWLALGMVELIARLVQVRFVAWLFAVSYTLVAVVILLVDPLKVTALTKDLPKPSKTYDALPLLLIDGAHVVSVLALVGCAGFTAWLASRRDVEAQELMIPIALVALAGVLVVSGTRGLLPAPAAVIALGAAAGLVWYGSMRTLPVFEEGEDGYDEHPTGYDEPPARAVSANAMTAAPDRPAGRRRRPPEPMPQQPPVPAPPPAGPPAGPGGLNGPNALNDVMAAAAAAAAGPPDTSQVCGQITVYTLLDGREEAFDRLAADLIAAARGSEPDNLVFTSHQVVNAPTQRIFYQLFRNQAAFSAHQNLPHQRRFQADSRPHVLATNVIEIRLGAAKILPLPGGDGPAPLPPGGAPTPPGPPNARPRR